MDLKSKYGLTKQVQLKAVRNKFSSKYQMFWFLRVRK